MLTKQERELVDYWKNWKPGMKAYEGKDISEKKLKHIKKAKQKKTTF